MAAVTTTAIGLGMSGYMAYQGAQKKKEAQGLLDNYDRTDLTNPYEDVKISTIGSDLLREENQRTAAGLIDASRGAGIRGIMGAIPKIQAQTNLENKEAQKYLDDQVTRREYAIAGDKTNIRAMKENRDNANIAALSSQVEAGNQDMWNGITGVAKSAIYGANNIDFTGEGNPDVETVSSGLTPIGINTMDRLKTKNPWAFDPIFSSIK